MNPYTGRRLSEAGGGRPAHHLQETRMTDTTDPQTDFDRRERYATAISKWHRDPEQPLYAQGADAVMAVADAEHAELRRERDLAIAHDRQPYPTAWAYEQACKALRRKTEAIERVRALHVPDENGECRACGASFDPCPTIAALDTQPADGPGRMADEEQQAETQAQGAAPGEALDLADGPVRCPLCPYPVTLHTPNGARAHFTTVHPEQRITGRGPGPWPLLVADGDEEQAEGGADQDGTLIDDYLRFLRGQGPEPDLTQLPPADREAIAGRFEIVRALADRDPELPPLDLDPVARRLGLHQPDAAPVAGQPPADTTGEGSRPRFVRVCVACPECDHTLDGNGACANGCHVPPAVVAEPGKEK